LILLAAQGESSLLEKEKALVYCSAWEEKPHLRNTNRPRQGMPCGEEA